MERKAGIDFFFTDTEGVGGRLKKYPEDFVVDELIDLPEGDKDGDYCIAKVWSRNWETNRLVNSMARELRIDRNHIDFAGTKDKRAITTQWMSFKTDPEELASISLRDVEITGIFRSNNNLYIGSHWGNRFEITVRDLDISFEDTEEIVSKTAKQLEEAGGFPNWFGVQRFGTIRPITHEIGRLIINGDYEGAVKLYIAEPMEGEGELSYEARKYLQETWDYGKALEIFPTNLTFERAMLAHLADHPEDYTGALKRLPVNLLRMFVHAFQSYLFNRMISMRVRRGLPLNDAIPGDVLLPTDRKGMPNVDTPVEINERNLKKASKMVREGKAYVSAPLFGFNSRFSSGEQGEIERKVIEEEGCKKKDLIVPELREISSKGTRRAIFAPISDLDYSVDQGGLKLSFGLFKGTYATSLLREFMKLPDEDSNLYS